MEENTSQERKLDFNLQHEKGCILQEVSSPVRHCSLCTTLRVSFLPLQQTKWNGLSLWYRRNSWTSRTQQDLILLPLPVLSSASHNIQHTDTLLALTTGLSSRPAPQEHPPQLPLCSPHSPTPCSTYHSRTGSLSPSLPPVPKADLYNIVFHSFCLHFSAFMSCEWHHRWKQTKIRVHAAEHSKGSSVEIRGIFRISALLCYLR